MSPKDILKNLDQKITGSKYFTWAEALWLPQMQAYALPSQEQVNNIIRLAQALDKVRDHYNKPIKVHCWLRTPMYNLLVKGARQSTHLTGSGVDFHVDGVDCTQVQIELERRKDIWPYRGEKGTATWVHLDLTEGRWFYP